MLELLGISATQTPACLTDANASLPSDELIPEVNTISGLSETIFSQSGDIISNCGIPSGRSVTYCGEYVSHAMILSDSPRSESISVSDGESDMIAFIVSGTVI